MVFDALKTDNCYDDDYFRLFSKSAAPLLDSKYNVGVARLYVT